MKSPAAFVKSLSFEKVLAAFEKATGITVQGGSVAKLATGERVVSLAFESGQHTPFQVTSSSPGRVKIERGFVSYAGTTYYFPAAVYSGTAPGGVFLKITTHYTAIYDAAADFWFWRPVPSRPELVWRVAGTVGSYCQITEDSAGVPTIGPSQTLYIPIAGHSGGQGINYISRNIFIEHGENGDIDYRSGWG
jgi:hypothetical protein